MNARHTVMLLVTNSLLSGWFWAMLTEAVNVSLWDLRSSRNCLHPSNPRTTRLDSPVFREDAVTMFTALAPSSIPPLFGQITLKLVFTCTAHTNILTFSFQRSSKVYNKTFRAVFLIATWPSNIDSWCCYIHIYNMILTKVVPHRFDLITRLAPHITISTRNHCGHACIRYNQLCTQFGKAVTRDVWKTKIRFGFRF